MLASLASRETPERQSPPVSGLPRDRVLMLGGRWGSQGGQGEQILEVVWRPKMPETGAD